MTFQAQISETPSFDIVIGILGHKLGSDMPRDWPTMPDGKPYPSGTAYELLTAIAASASRQVPDVYIFKKQGGPALPENEDDEREACQQWERLKTFWREFIYSRQEGFKAGFLRATAMSTSSTRNSRGCCGAGLSAKAISAGP